MDTELIEPKVKNDHTIEAMAVEATREERRGARRRKVLKGATITFNNGYGALQCVARNMTENGAMLAFGDTTGVPSDFEIKFAGSQAVFRAQIRWRRPQFVGVTLSQLTY